MLVEVRKLRKVKKLGDAFDEGAGSSLALENLHEGLTGYTKSDRQPVKTNSLFLTSFLYNIPYEWLVGCFHLSSSEYKSTSFEVFCQDFIHHLRGVNKWETLPKVDSVDMGKRIKALRKALGLSQKEFAERLGKGLATIQRWESGQTVPNDKTLRLISHTFGVSYEWLKEGKGEMWEKEETDVPEWWKEKLKSIEPKDVELLKELIELLESLSEEEKEFLRLLLKKQAEKKKGGS